MEELAADPGLARRLLDDPDFIAALVRHAAESLLASSDQRARPSMSESNRV
jgi:hypothetical protein